MGTGGHGDMRTWGMRRHQDHRVRTWRCREQRGHKRTQDGGEGTGQSHHMSPHVPDPCGHPQPPPHSSLIAPTPLAPRGHRKGLTQCPWQCHGPPCGPGDISLAPTAVTWSWWLHHHEVTLPWLLYPCLGHGVTMTHSIAGPRPLARDVVPLSRTVATPWPRRGPFGRAMVIPWYLQPRP